METCGTLGGRGDAWDNGPDAPATLAGPPLYQIHSGILKPGDTVVTTNLATRGEGRPAAKSIGRATATSRRLEPLGLLTDAHR